MSNPPVNAADTIQRAIIDAIQCGDQQALNHWIELSLIHLDSAWTADLLCATPTLVDSCLVPRALRMLHGERWIEIARAICTAAATELVQHAGAIPGTDVSLGVDSSGAPVLYLARPLLEAVTQEHPDALHLVRSFLQVEGVCLQQPRRIRVS